MIHDECSILIIYTYLHIQTHTSLCNYCILRAQRVVLGNHRWFLHYIMCVNGIKQQTFCKHTMVWWTWEWLPIWAGKVGRPTGGCKHAIFSGKHGQRIFWPTWFFVTQPRAPASLVTLWGFRRAKCGTDVNSAAGPQQHFVKHTSHRLHMELHESTWFPGYQCMVSSHIYLQRDEGLVHPGGSFEPWP